MILFYKEVLITWKIKYLNQNYTFTSWADTQVANTTHTYKLNIIKTAKPIIMGLWEFNLRLDICYLIKISPLYELISSCYLSE